MTIISASQLAPETDISAIEDQLLAARRERIARHGIEFEMRQPAFEHEAATGLPGQSAAFDRLAEGAAHRFERQRETLDLDWGTVTGGPYREIFAATDSISAPYGYFLIGDSNTHGAEPGETQSSRGGRSFVEPANGNLGIRAATATSTGTQGLNWSGASLGAVFTKRDNGRSRVRARSLLRKRAALSLAFSNFTPAAISVEIELTVGNLTRQTHGSSMTVFHSHANPGHPVDHSAAVPGIHMGEAWTGASPGDTIIVILGIDAFISAAAHAHARFDLDAHLAWLGID